MPRTALPVLLLLLTCLLPACRAEERAAPERQPAFIRVDNRTVTLEAFRSEFAASLPPGQELAVEERRQLERSFLVQVIDRELVLAEGDRLGVSVSPTEVEAALQEYRRDYPAGAFEEMLRERGISLEPWRRELRQGLLVEKVVRKAAYAGLTVDDGEVADYYREHRDEFDRPEQVRARQIVVRDEAEGQRVLGLLRQGEPFAAVAREHSLSPDGEQGGDLGFFARGEMPPEFDTVVFSLPVGRLSDLVQSEYGYHIFLVEERREALHLDQEAAAEEIRAALRAQKEELAHQRWLQELRGRAAIEVDWSLL